MRTRRINVGLGALVAAALAVLWLVGNRSRTLALIVREFTTRQEIVADAMGQREFRDSFVATIELTNASTRPVAYWAFLNGKLAVYNLLHKTADGWKDDGARWVCGTGLVEATLPPAQAVTFEAVIDPDKPCKVAVSYFEKTPPKRRWQWLPRWLARRMPKGSSGGTLTTEVIDLRGETQRVRQRPKPLAPSPN